MQKIKSTRQLQQSCPKGGLQAQAGRRASKHKQRKQAAGQARTSTRKQQEARRARQPGASERAVTSDSLADKGTGEQLPMAIAQPAHPALAARPETPNAIIGCFVTHNPAINKMTSASTPMSESASVKTPFILPTQTLLITLKQQESESRTIRRQRIKCNVGQLSFKE